MSASCWSRRWRPSALATAPASCDEYASTARRLLCTMQPGMTHQVVRLPRIGMGCMRLSTAADRDDARAITVIHAALDAGVRLFDTADAYARDASEMGHNERLIAAALRSWSGDARTVVVATKGGMTRPGGLWVT